VIVDLQALLSDIREEVIRSTAKYRPMRSAHEGYAILREEVDEMWDAIKANELWEARREALQVAAMAIRFLIDVRTPEQANNTRDGRKK
jgi:hypothetical protein